MDLTNDTECVQKSESGCVSSTLLVLVETVALIKHSKSFKTVGGSLTVFRVDLIKYFV